MVTLPRGHDRPAIGRGSVMASTPVRRLRRWRRNHPDDARSRRDVTPPIASSRAVVRLIRSEPSDSRWIASAQARRRRDRASATRLIAARPSAGHRGSGDRCGRGGEHASIAIDRHRSPSIAIDRSVGRPAGDEADLPRGPSGVRGLRNSPRSHAPARVCRSAVPLARLGEGPAWRRGKPSIRDLDESCRATKQLPSHPFFGPLLDPLRPPRPRRVRWFVRRGGVLLPRAGGARHGRPEPRWLDRRR